MKSVTIKDRKGDILIKIVHTKNGKYTCVHAGELDGQIYIEARDDKNCKVEFKTI